MIRGQAVGVVCRDDRGLEGCATLREEARGAQGITAVVTAARNHQDPLARRAVEPSIDEAGQLPGRDLHQLERRDAKALAGRRVRRA